VGRRSGDPLLTFAVPVPGGDAPLEAILAGTIRLDLPSGGFARLGTSLSNVVLIDGAGHVVLDRGAIADLRTAHPDFLAALRAENGAPEALADPNGTPGWAGATARIGDTAWWAVVLRPSDAVWGPVEETRELQVAALVLLGVIGMGAAWIVGRGLDRGAAADRRRVEAAAERERFLREFTDALPVAAGVLDAELRPITANRSYRALGGADLPRLVHHEDVDLLPAPDRVESLTVDVRILDRAAPDGVRWHRMSFVPETVTDEARWFFAAVDVDREKRAELGLQRDVAERDEFLGLVSHELRTPLTVIVGTALTLLRGRASLAPEVADGLDDIHESARRLQRLLENMLVLSRMSVEGLRDDVEPQVLLRLVERTLEDFRRLAPDREIRMSVPDDVPIVLANPTHVDQVLWNLLTNAAKYGGAGTPIDLAISTGAGHVAVAVSDRGPGIPPGEQDVIFEAHYRTAGGRSAAGGLGLGLSVCRRLVELQGGTITVTARPGGGSTFTFTLPSVAE
jgi:signal transduction histidine kinase